MNQKEFWNIYNQYCAHNITPACSFRNNPLTGDSGAFVIGIFKNSEGKWCIEETVERSNNSYHREYELEEEAFFDMVIKIYGRKLRNLSFPEEYL